MSLAMVQHPHKTEVPSLIDGEAEAGLTPEIYNLEFWLHTTPQGSLRGLVHGHAPNLTVPRHMLGARPAARGEPQGVRLPCHHRADDRAQSEPPGAHGAGPGDDGFLRHATDPTKPGTRTCFAGIWSRWASRARSSRRRWRRASGNYELIPGRRLADTTVEERIGLQAHWSDEMRGRRLARMGLAPSLRSAR